MDNTNNINNNAEKLILNARQTVMVTNMSLATALETPFMATYESDQGILVMALRANNTAIMAATGDGSNNIIKSDVIISGKSIGERKTIFQCETEEDSSRIWELLNDRLYEWSKGETDMVELD